MNGKNEPWSGPEPEDVEEWQKPEPAPLPMPRKPNILPVKVSPFKWIGDAIMPPEPKCPRCRGELVYRRRDDAGWCRPCDRAFYHRSVMDVLHAAGLWHL